MYVSNISPSEASDGLLTMIQSKARQALIQKTTWHKQIGFSKACKKNWNKPKASQQGTAYYSHNNSVTLSLEV